jgi:hypothetical protein
MRGRHSKGQESVVCASGPAVTARPRASVYHPGACQRTCACVSRGCWWGRVGTTRSWR